MLKVMTIVGTRPELIKMSRVIPLFDKYTNHILVHTGQNYDYELNQIFFDELGIRKPDYFLGAVGSTAAETIGSVIIKADEVLRKELPDALLLYGDTNSCLSVISAKRLKIPVFHMESGNRCFDQRVPEELNRKVVDHLSDVNFVLSNHARTYLLNEGMRPELVIKTGSHMPEVFDHYQNDIESSMVLKNEGLKPKEYFLVSAHREENVDDFVSLNKLISALKSLARVYNCPVLISTHPRTRNRLENFGINIDDEPLLKFHKPFGFFDYIKLQKNAKCVLSDSGTITEESSILGFPAVTIRNTHERPEGNDVGLLILTGLNENTLLDSVAVTIATSENESPKNNCIIPDYEFSYVSHKILKIVLGYTGYINRTVWHSPRD